MTKLDYLLQRGIEVLDEMPEGWKVDELATTAPTGYVWINNGKSLFGGEYKHALLKKE